MFECCLNLDVAASTSYSLSQRLFFFLSLYTLLSANDRINLLKQRNPSKLNYTNIEYLTIKYNLGFLPVKKLRDLKVSG
jgi:hypothetical protein